MLRSVQAQELAGGFLGSLSHTQPLGKLSRAAGSLARSRVAGNPPRAGLVWPTCNAWTGHCGSAAERATGWTSTRQPPRRDQMDQGPLPGAGGRLPFPSSPAQQWGGQVDRTLVSASRLGGPGPGSPPPAAVLLGALHVCERREQAPGRQVDMPAWDVTWGKGRGARWALGF